MKNLFLYRIWYILTYPFLFYRSDERKVQFYLRYLCTNPYMYAYALCQAKFESGDFANTWTAKYNNPFAMGYSQNSPVMVKAVGNTVSASTPNFAKYPNLAEAVYDYLHRNIVRFNTTRHAMVDLAPNVYINSEFGMLNNIYAHQYFNDVSFAMVSTGYVTGVNVATYGSGVWAYYQTTLNQMPILTYQLGPNNTVTGPVFDTKYKYFKAVWISMLLTYPIVITAIAFFYKMRYKSTRAKYFGTSQSTPQFKKR